MFFSDSDKKVFKYNDGQKDVYADPLDVRRRLLQSSGGAFYRLCQQAREPEPPPELPAGAPPADQGGPGYEHFLMAALTARGRLNAAMRQAFGLPEFDPTKPGGVTEAMVDRIYDEYVKFMEGEEKPDGK